MLLVSISQVILISREVRNQQEQLLRHLTATQVPLLQTALWDIETLALERQLQRIVELEDIASLHLQTETGLGIDLGEPPVGSADTTLLIVSPLDERQRLGELQIHFNNQRMARLIRDSIVQRVLEFSLYTLMLFAILFRLLHQDIGKPLRGIADYVATLRPQKNAPRLALVRSQRSWFDEIDLISRGFETLHEGISHYAEQHENAIEQLARERDSLDLRVAERTSELGYLNGYLKLISGTSLKLMHLRQEQYPRAMAQTLQTLAQYLHLDACALLDDGRLRTRWMEYDDEQWLDGLTTAFVRASGWSVTRLDERTLLIGFVSQQRRFVFAARGRASSDVSAEREELLQGAGQWLFSLLQHWDHVIGLEQAQQELLKMSRTDPLTGLANRRHFEQHQVEELHRAQRMGYPVSLLMLDVDFFKGYNDHYGHAEGDACLAAVANLMKDRFKRAGEMVARVGGEEFAVLLPGLDLDAARQCAEALGMAIYDLHLPHAESVWGRVTVSIGCSCWSVEHGGDTDQIIDSLSRLADKALYDAKRAGRNQVVALRREALSGVQ
ncbi:GGDEF domain-containing protein [Halopseudomonas formosensis]|nr:GGDEF domain-containing protein [Halopseudomonas formosensis]